MTNEVNLVLAQLLETRGDLAGALRVLGRHTPYAGANNLHRTRFLRERGRVALLAADTLAAVRAHRAYLALRSDPEPALRPERDRIRAELARLAQRSAVPAGQH